MLDTDGSVLMFVGYHAFTCPPTGATSNCQTIRMARSADGLDFKVHQGSIRTRWEMEIAG
jgi:hypothetical protein